MCNGRHLFVGSIIIWPLSSRGSWLADFRINKDEQELRGSNCSWTLLVCVANLSEALVLAHCHCLLFCLISVTLKPTCTLFTSFSSSPCSHSYYLPDSLTPGPYRCFLCLAILLVPFHVQAGNIVCFLPEFFTPRHTDTWSDKLPLNEQMWGLLTLAPNYWAASTKLVTYM